ncbi:hypothetical protein [Variovorax saccharolyticus]|uniref:hypothetical protein n=1 Tax=Variovorax saccharolyticus TaxID=3053516 RepID=UPI0025791BEF|nr:hypothetical protein [Variovorax sp. J31P216]MDM0029865.1 hypothetical protein [Variovorax sp. J31P216]
MTIELRIDEAVLRRLTDICRRLRTRVPNTVRSLLIEAVQRGNFDGSPWDSSVTDNGYMPYEMMKKRIERARKAKEYQAEYYIRRQVAPKSSTRGRHG